MSQFDSFTGKSMSNFLKHGRLEPGMIIDFQGGKQLIVGNCTPYIQPTPAGGGIGWYWEIWEDSIISKITQLMDTKSSNDANDLDRIRDRLREFLIYASRTIDLEQEATELLDIVGRPPRVG